MLLTQGSITIRGGYSLWRPNNIPSSASMLYLEGEGGVVAGQEGLDSPPPNKCCLPLPIVPHILPDSLDNVVQPGLAPVGLSLSGGVLVYKILVLLQDPHAPWKFPLMCSYYRLAQRLQENV